MHLPCWIAVILVGVLCSAGCDSRPSASSSQPAAGTEPSPAAQPATASAQATSASAPTSTQASTGGSVLYREDFEQVDIGAVPEDFLLLEGEFTVRELGGNRVLELPGAPLSAFGLLFGPRETDNVAVRARFNGSRKGRRYPSFGVGFGGSNGYQLMVSPGKEALELYQGEDLLAHAPYEWTSEQWTEVLLRLRRVADGQWKIEGKAWPHGTPEPDAWMIGLDSTEEPETGRASLWGSPFAGTPIQFDELALIKLDSAAH